jgi:hypothetical protein
MHGANALANYTYREDEPTRSPRLIVVLVAVALLGLGPAYARAQDQTSGSASDQGDPTAIKEAIADGKNNVPAESASGLTVEIMSGPAGPTSDPLAHFEFAVSGPKARVECSLESEGRPRPEDGIDALRREFASLSRAKQREGLERAMSTPAERASRARFAGCTGASTHRARAPLADGQYTFRVRATSGGESATAIQDFTIATGGADPTISSPPTT